MIISIGTDIVEVHRIREVLKRTPRFALRVFTEAERAYCNGRGDNAPQHYAARFAAKEAVLKALRTGWSAGVAWHDVEVASTISGAPILKFHGRARQLFERTGATDAYLSISHTAELAIAHVVLERTVGERQGI